MEASTDSSLPFPAPPSEDRQSAAAIFNEARNVNVHDGRFWSINARTVNISGSTSRGPASSDSDNNHFLSAVNQQRHRNVSDNANAAMQIRKDSQVYHDCLFSKGRGSALWMPGSNVNLCAEYRKDGTRIGDVGIIKGTGAFSFLFNILLPADDVINRGRVPPSFVPLEDADFIRLSIEKSYRADDYVASNSVTQSTSVGESGLIFESFASEGAVLATPGAVTVSEILENRVSFHVYIKKHLQCWYEYVNGPLGRQAQNGDIRVVYGTEKVASWGMATFHNSSESRICLEYRKVSTTGSSVTRTPYAWSRLGSGASHVGPAIFEITDLTNDSTPLFNQSVFIRTLNPELPDELWKDKIAHTIGLVADKDDLPIRNPSQIGPQSSTSSSQFSQMIYFESGEPPKSKTVTVDDAISHPSAHLNRILFSCAPKAEIVISDDQDLKLVFEMFPDLLKYANTAANVSQAVLAGERFTSPLFALIIGINNYADGSIPNLGGAVPDANQVHQFLVSRLKVQPDRIVNLRDASATRKAILAAIQGLAANPFIQPTDPILIYYAGYGAEVPCPISSWAPRRPGGKIQMILPYDFIVGGSTGKDGQGIFDVTLSSLLLEVAVKKSDNITVILDCCHSGSSIRQKDHPDPERDRTLLVRGVKLPDTYTVPADILTAEQLRASSLSSGYEKAGVMPHIVLSACLPGQTAKERKGHGAFTSALLRLLETEGVEQLTYVDVIYRLPDLPLQNPQCESHEKNRILFDSKIVSSSRQVFIVKPSAVSLDSYVIDAGEADGITPSSSFAVYLERGLTSQSFIGTIIITSVYKSQSLALCAEGASFSATHATMYAVQTHVGEEFDLRLLIEPKEEFSNLLLRLDEEMQLRITDKSHRSFRLVNGIEENPHLVLRVRPNFLQPTDPSSFSSPSYSSWTKDGDNGNSGKSSLSVQFEVMEPLCRQYGLTEMPYENVKTDETGYLFRILSSAADFYWKLHHSNKAVGVNPSAGARSQNVKGGTMMSALERSISPTGGGKCEGASSTGTTSAQNHLELECFKLVSARAVLTQEVLSSKADVASEQLYKRYLDNDLLVPLPSPGGGNPENLCVDGSIVLDLTEPDVQYGFKITNWSETPLYAALFYFDISDLSISSYYTPSLTSNFSNNVDFTLPAKGAGSLKIGFEDSGTPPCEYFLRPGQLVDIGLLKLYFSTEYVDFSQVGQESPFLGDDLDKEDVFEEAEQMDEDEKVELGMGKWKGKRKREDGQFSYPKIRPMWDALCVPVIQKRGLWAEEGCCERKDYSLPY